jgi:teichuronic acid biosynthesis protein TuaE
MTLTTFHHKIQGAFFRQGWLLPAVLPLTQISGRASFNVVAGIYTLWGLLSLWSRRQQLDRAAALLYLVLLSVFLLGIPGAMEPMVALRTWGMFLMQSMTLLLTQAALRESHAQLDRLLNVMALFGGVTLAGLYVLLTSYVFGKCGQLFDHSGQLQEDSLPFLLPFMLGWFWRRGQGHWRHGAMTVIIAASAGYVVLAEGRAALLGLSVGLAVFYWTVLSWRPYWIALLMVLVLGIGIVANTRPFCKAEMDLEHPLDAFTTGRTILWRQALAHPPTRSRLGVGIGNVFQAKQVLNFEINGDQVQVKHLHNFLMDAWYETGSLGLGALLVLIGTILWRLAWMWRRLSAEDRQRAGVLLAAALAIMTAGLLSFSYTSRYFACYLFVCLGGLSYFAILPAAVDTDSGKH